MTKAVKVDECDSVKVSRLRLVWGCAYKAAPLCGRTVPSEGWRGAGAVDRGGLENRCTLMGTEGSNPSLSANM